MSDLGTTGSNHSEVASAELRLHRRRLTLILAGAMALVGAARAAGEVLVNSPPARGCLGNSIDVGVWWKQTTPERSYRVEIRDPTGRLVFARVGEAPDRWLIWHYVPRRTGTFRIVYLPQAQYGTFKTVINSTGCFSGNVAGAGTGPGHRFVVGDGLYLNFHDRFAYGTPYRVCWEQTNGSDLHCWARRTSTLGHNGRIFTPAPQRVGTYVVRWYVRGHLAARWSFYTGQGD